VAEQRRLDRDDVADVAVVHQVFVAFDLDWGTPARPHRPGVDAGESYHRQPRGPTGGEERGVRGAVEHHGGDLERALVGDPPTIPADGKLMPTAALARLEIAGDWRDIGPSCGHLLSVTRPGEIADDQSSWVKSPYRSALGPIPEHFFTQSAIIPYRRADTGLEFLLVESRSGKRWVIPKGVKEPDLGPAESAAKEAFEEAGVRGTVDPEPLGSYTYDKWGGTCTVTVFGMEVSECLPEGEWAESHRKRRWLAPGEAASRLDESGLRKLVGELASRLRGG
jgi:phosphohistidine phosphatase